MFIKKLLDRIIDSIFDKKLSRSKLISEKDSYDDLYIAVMNYEEL